MYSNLQSCHPFCDVPGLNEDVDAGDTTGRGKRSFSLPALFHWVNRWCKELSGVDRADVGRGAGQEPGRREDMDTENGEEAGESEREGEQQGEEGTNGMGDGQRRQGSRRQQPTSSHDSTHDSHEKGPSLLPSTIDAAEVVIVRCARARRGKEAMEEAFLEAEASWAVEDAAEDAGDAEEVEEGHAATTDGDGEAGGTNVVNGSSEKENLSSAAINHTTADSAGDDAGGGLAEHIEVTGEVTRRDEGEDTEAAVARGAGSGGGGSGTGSGDGGDGQRCAEGEGGDGGDEAGECAAIRKEGRDRKAQNVSTVEEYEESLPLSCR